MTDTNTVTSLATLPANATFGEAMAWLDRMRRLIDRWDTLPESATRSMTPVSKREAYAELDLMKDTLLREMAMANTQRTRR
jgi:hypothetical protein